ncbi:hypothetical protein ACQKM2_08970 [Streptomyces sp. NPDC004126]|uniref:hypothetical protein n=1 Tax=Streptomyces sp. NPDC004126 TaxID=3390695 RepID=UPI003D06CD39
MDRVLARHAWEELTPSEQGENCRIYRQNGALAYGLALIKAGKTKEEAAALIDLVDSECR